MKAHILGFPRIGTHRELKHILEAYWSGSIPLKTLNLRTAKLRQEHWQIQQDSGLDTVATGDFSLYDHMLDTALMLGAVPPRFNTIPSSCPENLYFRMARGDAEYGITAMEMTKWFDTNYHYIVPEFTEGMELKYSSSKLVDETREAIANGFFPKPVLVGPLTFLQLAKDMDGGNRWDYLDTILGIYETVIAELAQLADCIQLDEPVLCTDLPDEVKALAPRVYEKLKSAAGKSDLMLATYFGKLEDNLEWVAELPVDVLHIDLVHGSGQLQQVLKKWPKEKQLSLGVVNGRNIWKTYGIKATQLLRNAIDNQGSEKLWIGSSCSLLHSPVDLQQETELDPELRDWMAFAVQKCDEISFLREAALSSDMDRILQENIKSIRNRKSSPRTLNPAIRQRTENITSAMTERRAPFSVRIKEQQNRLNLPPFPTTTIGSFPQTNEIRRTRRAFRTGQCSDADYQEFIRKEIRDVIRTQEEIGLDVLVHGEAERNDMVEYFGQQLEGFCFTQNGWVQSYGSRCVKPPIIYGDVSRAASMTVEWTRYAQEQTDKPLKGMLTGPVTILCWSFVRDDLPRSEVCRQLALAIRDEVQDLEAAGISIIQIDEAALREGMPLRIADRQDYLDWAVDGFRLTVGGVKNSTQIHTHMCYSEFNAIAKAIAAMDADVVSIESSRSGMELLDAFKDFEYPNDIGPGVWDIHSPRVPSEEEIFDLLQKARKVIPDERLWVNPDCGLKTRAWPETLASLNNMVAATLRLRHDLPR
ncbi:5-methyltetrahydropteroyltriglutamate--homocysteine S-methyltransferase [Pontiellaceae bacterium B12219]|nr:5-methyltetrahydropteroyltriglutamate--homocysteine S-methyltransferase [Pontiellaceae bacterium B12219]